MARIGHTTDAVLSHIRQYRSDHKSSPSRGEIARALRLAPATVNYHVNKLLESGRIATAGPRRLIVVLDYDLPVVRLGPIPSCQQVTEAARQVGTVPPHVGAKFTPYPCLFALVPDDALAGAGLHAGDRVAIHAGPPANGSIVLARWRGELLLRRYRLRSRRTIVLEPANRAGPYRKLRILRRDANLTIEGTAAGALVFHRHP